MISKKIKSLVNLMAGMTLVGSTMLALGAVSGYNEYEVRAAFIYRVLHYVKWNEILPEPDTKLVICSNVDAPFSRLLSSLEKQKVFDRTIEVVVSKNVTDLKNCNVIYLNDLSSEQVRKYIKKFEGKKTLTIGEQNGFAHAGGVINLLFINQQIDFEVNIDAAERLQMKFSAKFLRVAKNIIRDNVSLKNK